MEYKRHTSLLPRFMQNHVNVKLMRLILFEYMILIQLENTPELSMKGTIFMFMNTANPKQGILRKAAECRSHMYEQVREPKSREIWADSCLLVQLKS